MVVGVDFLPVAIDDERILTVEAVLHNFITNKLTRLSSRLKIIRHSQLYTLPLVDQKP